MKKTEREGTCILCGRTDWLLDEFRQPRCTHCGGSVLWDAQPSRMHLFTAADEDELEELRGPRHHHSG